MQCSVKVNIPFKILSFSDVYGDDNRKEEDEYGWRTDTVRLLEWFSSDMSKQQYLKAGKVFGAIYNAKKAGNSAYGWLSKRDYESIADWFGIDTPFEEYDPYGIMQNITQSKNLKYLDCGLQESWDYCLQEEHLLMQVLLGQDTLFLS